jgi:hypothetical protein
LRRCLEKGRAAIFWVPAMLHAVFMRFFSQKWLEMRMDIACWYLNYIAERVLPRGAAANSHYCRPFYGWVLTSIWQASAAVSSGCAAIRLLCSGSKAPQAGRRSAAPLQKDGAPAHLPGVAD